MDFEENSFVGGSTVGGKRACSEMEGTHIADVKKLRGNCVNSSVYYNICTVGSTAFQVKMLMFREVAFF